jgi:hypothetical protein
MRFPPKHECPTDPPKLANPFLSSLANTSVGPVMVLMEYALDDFPVALWKQLLDRQAAGEYLRPGASLEGAASLQSVIPTTLQFEGTLRLVVIENPHARIPFPADVFRGPFDQRWTWHDGWCKPTWMGATAGYKIGYSHKIKGPLGRFRRPLSIPLCVWCGEGDLNPHGVTR